MNQMAANETELHDGGPTVNENVRKIFANHATDAMCSLTFFLNTAGLLGARCHDFQAFWHFAHRSVEVLVPGSRAMGHVIFSISITHIFSVCVLECSFTWPPGWKWMMAFDRRQAQK